MVAQTRLPRTIDPSGLRKPATPRLRRWFWIAWSVDLTATILLFVLPYGYELNPVTVFLYAIFGLPGVVLAAASYAALVVLIGFVLTKPFDGAFAIAVATLYAAFAINNVVLVVFREPLLVALVEPFFAALVG